MSYTLVIGNKNYSSGSFRPWIAMKTARIAFEELVIPLYRDGSSERIRAYSPAGKVPILLDGNVRVWESIAILEYLSERHPDARLWPTDPAARAHARALAAEMHAGFAPLRRGCPMNMWRPPEHKDVSPEIAANVRRIEQMWADCRTRFAAAGPFLFGTFGAADAMYAPVVSRFITYGIGVSPAARAYMDAVTSLPAWSEWADAALREEWVIAEDEPDWPKVPRMAPP
jgi:glutathione S-transferase